MDLKIVEKVLNHKSIPAINRETGLDIDIYKSLHEVKMEILQEACIERSVEMCISDEDQIETIIHGCKAYTEEQEKFITLIHKHGLVAKPLEPELIEEDYQEDHQEEIADSGSEISEESKNILEESKIIMEANEVNKNINLKDLLSLFDKLAMCPDFSSLQQLSESFNKVGFEIKENNNKVMLCLVNEKELKIFENYMLIGISTDPNKELSSRFIECLIKFIRKTAISEMPEQPEPEKNWQQTQVGIYGDAIREDQK